jgi:hypothetical protein
MQSRAIVATNTNEANASTSEAESSFNFTIVAPFDGPPQPEHS